MPRAHIVVIDDHAAARASVRALVEAFDYEVTTFDSAEAYLQDHQLQHHACLLVDVHLPGMNGRELLLTLNQRGKRPPVILISGYVEPNFIKEAIHDGAVCVLEKPINPGQLMAHLESAVENPQPSTN